MCSGVLRQRAIDLADECEVVWVQCTRCHAWQGPQYPGSPPWGGRVASRLCGMLLAGVLLRDGQLGRIREISDIRCNLHLVARDSYLPRGIDRHATAASLQPSYSPPTARLLRWPAAALYSTLPRRCRCASYTVLSGWAIGILTLRTTGYWGILRSTGARISLHRGRELLADERVTSHAVQQWESTERGL